MGISSIGRNIGSKAYEYGVKKPFLWLADMRLMDKGYASYRANNRKVIDGIGIASIILKDGVGCYMYVNQSLHNDKIPEDKRKFVAALDLANGGLMILAQIIMHMTISSKIVQAKMFEKMFGKYFDRNALKMTEAILKNTEKYKNVPSREIAEAFSKFKGSICDAFCTITSLFAATTIGKRVIVPFIATPLAGKVEQRMNKNKKQDVIDKDTVNAYNPNRHNEFKKEQTQAQSPIQVAQSAMQTAGEAIQSAGNAIQTAGSNLLAGLKK